MMITAAELQNSLLLIDQHVDGVIEAIEVGEDDIVEATLRDIKEVTADLRSYLPERYARAGGPNEQDIGSIADELEEF